MASVKPIRIQLSREAGFQLQAYSRSRNGLQAVKVDRSTRFGNPYRVGEPIDMKQARRWGWDISPAGRTVVCGNAGQATLRFRWALLWDQAIHDYLRAQLGGKNLACWCYFDEACHADPLLFVANSTKEEINSFHRAADERLRSRLREEMQNAY